MIEDEEQFKKFLDILPDLEKDEIYFCSLSARQKYLDDKEREYYGLGRTEMFSREIARSKHGLYLTLAKMKKSLLYRKTNLGLDIPKKCLVTYININPSSSIKAFMNFNKDMSKNMLNIFMAERNNKIANYESFIRIPTKLMNCIQKAQSRKYFIDIDCDAEDITIVNNIIKSLINNKVIFHIIETKSGYHILIQKNTLNKEVRLYELVKETNNKCKEVIFNKNYMIPVPGTLQAGKLVRII